MISARAANNIQSVDILTVGASALVKNQYDASKNPQGIINMGVAENKLMAEELTSKISITLNPSDLSYGSFAGSRDLRKQIAGLMNRRLKLDSEHALTDSQVVVGNGAGSMVSCIAQILADPYDAVLIPAPVYGAFNKDLYYTALVKPVYVNAKDALPSVDMLEEAFAVTQNVKALLITNPGNPTGRLVPRDLLRAWIAWANEKKIHCIVDEVYMLSVWSGAEFTSVLAMDLDLVDPARTHVIWSFSKDFGLNGLRVGAIISRNNSVIQGYKELAYFHAVPTSLDNALAGFLSDEDFVDSFVATNHSRMREIFGILQSLTAFILMKSHNS
ncbi:hypothetical protein HDU83_001615 [Entophlyctis luteolus]|nr:hypothetical protein HDU82_006872 [Entophlyctis luteolus]KAJ3348022.1 hypothetical protein HDU83_001615 [Entophlyctis luteolus]KAJ3379650.1 hypothetical protein HDU84_006508 [Entophlyctis sp. JEL0112]